MKRWLQGRLAWFDARLGVRETLMPMLTHPIPAGAAGPMGWWYVFGSASLTLLLIQILTGIGLALVYVPTPDNAYEQPALPELSTCRSAGSCARCTTMPAPAWSSWSWPT